MAAESNTATVTGLLHTVRVFGLEW